MIFIFSILDHRSAEKVVESPRTIEDEHTYPRNTESHQIRPGPPLLQTRQRQDRPLFDKSRLPGKRCDDTLANQAVAAARLTCQQEQLDNERGGYQVSTSDW